jgi:LEA14-like dessication related protein
MEANVYRYIRSVVLGPFLLVLAACGGGVFQQPEVTIQSVQLAGIGLGGGTLVFNIQVMNPNRFSLNATQLSYELSIADTRAAGDTSWIDVAEGIFTEDFSVGAGATETLRLPIEFSYQGLGGAAGSILRAGTFTYRAAGMVDVRTPIGSRAVPFRRGGMVSLLGAG